jgi:Flp pilus assembly protein TadD
MVHSTSEGREMPVSHAETETLLRSGYQLLRQSRYRDAIALAEQAAVARLDPRLHELAAEGRLAAGDPAGALDQIAQAVRVATQPLRLLLKQADLLMRLRRRGEALAVAARATTLAGADVAAWRQLGLLHAGCHDVVGAKQAYQQACALPGTPPALRYDLATMQFFTGDLAAAEHSLDEVLAAVPGAGDAMYLRATTRRQDPQRNHVPQLRQAFAAGLGTPAATAACGYALAKELEDLGEHAESFRVLGEAARLQRRTLDYDAGVECDHIEALRTAYTTAALSQLAPAEPDAGSGAIFIVGMPRTGTTLLERMLVERGGARSAGELLDFASLLGQATAQRLAQDPAATPAMASRAVDFAALGREYLRGAREAAGGTAVFIDKMPVNYLYCGMIDAALPAARIVHLVRDPLDTCYAVYKTLFYNAYPFSYDLDELASYYLAYRATMQHWHAVLPGRILDVHYEDLVADPERECARVLAWCDLSDAGAAAGPALDAVPFVSASAAQVRGEVHTRSVRSARRHAAGLAGLEARLRAAGALDGRPQ